MDSTIWNNTNDKLLLKVMEVIKRILHDNPKITSFASMDLVLTISSITI